MIRIGDNLTVSEVDKDAGWILMHDDLGNSYEFDIDPHMIDDTTNTEDGE
jgi:hypothetical protein